MTWKLSMNLSGDDMKVKHEFVWSWYESQAWISLVMTWKLNMNLSSHDMKIKHEFVWSLYEKSIA